jgi:ADP-ribose pyrophosphatase YjhB (NUDIX family)
MELKNPLYSNIGAHVINSIFTIDKGEIKVLLIKRDNEPFKDYWALVGGAMYNNELIEDAAKRELKEKTNIENIDLTFVGVEDAIAENSSSVISSHASLSSTRGSITGSKRGLVCRGAFML